MKTKFSSRHIVTAVALSIGLAASAFAAPPLGEGPAQPTGMHERHMAHGMKELARLHDDLKLTAKQETLWQEAEKVGKESMNGMHERFTKHHEEIQAQLSQPGADLRAIAKRMDEFKAEGQKQHEANRDRWLAVYDALNAEQKEQARVFFKSKFEKLGHFGKREPGKN